LPIDAFLLNLLLYKIGLMVLVLKKGASKKEIEANEKKLYREKASMGFNAKKYNGILNLKKDPLAIQLKLRNEWERIKIIRL
jgi:hypothetical protein